MKLDIRYRMHFRYSEPVRESQNEVRVRPRDDETQRVVSFRLTNEPPTKVLSAFDYWGTAVEQVGVRIAHTALELTAETSVDTLPRPAPPPDTPVEALADPDFRARHFEFLDPSPHVDWQTGDSVAARAAAATHSARSVPDLLAAVVAEVRGALRYESGATDIGVSLEELLAGGAGVCQDFAHLAIGMLRSVGVPARYVSGYLFAADETAAGDETAEMVSVQTHAWIEAAVPGAGWCAFDPTNGGTVGERHVVIGCARDYGDVPPVRGVFMGGATAEVEAEVVIGKRPAVEPAPSPGARSWPRAVTQGPPLGSRPQQHQQQQQ
ncbi:MAG: transglutaminase family protein [Acidimicrobiia bacterium]|nr:transglutaminase family protein [Acidimicrobiia bacterium]MYE67500.1 transglutaminase family protein [Acidimicrobiia bacterium]